MVTTFSAILTQILNATEMNARQAHEQISKYNGKISYPAFAAYKAFTAVPSFEKAKIILDSFNYEITNDELLDILKYSKSELTSMNEGKQDSIQQGIRISPKAMGIDISVLDLKSMIENRIGELDIKGNYSGYVNILIKKDLIESGYISDDETGE